MDPLIRAAALVAALAGTARADDIRFSFTGGYKLEPIRADGHWLDRQAFSVLRPAMHAHVLEPWFEVVTSLELASNPPYLLDAYVDVTRYSELSLQAGQFHTPCSRAEAFDHHAHLFPDQAVVASYFSTGRDKGAMAYGDAGPVHYWLGTFGGSPLRQFTTISGNYVIVGRVSADSTPGLAKTEYPYMLPSAPTGISASLEGYVGKVQSAVENFNPTSFAFTPTPSGQTTRNAAVAGDVFAQSSRAMAFAEAYVRRTEVEGFPGSFVSWGVWGEAGVAIVANRLDIAARVNYVDPSTSLTDDTFVSLEGQLAYYFDPKVRLELRYGIGVQHDPGEAALGPVSLPVGVDGTIQVLTLQLDLSI